MGKKRKHQESQKKEDLGTFNGNTGKNKKIKRQKVQEKPDRNKDIPISAPDNQEKTNIKKQKRSRKRLKKAKLQAVAKLDPDIEVLKPTRTSNEPTFKRATWTNKERVLIFSSRGISFRDRHLMKDFKKMMPHSKSDTKMDKKDQLFVINEACEMKNCQKCIFFESKKKTDLYMWMSKCPRGPSAKFSVDNIHTMSELKMTGNCLRGTRPLLSFDKNFDAEPQWSVLKELFIQIFSTPNYHPRSQPFIDHVFNFSIEDNRIWFRNYQILDENGELAEIGPRMVLNPIRIFQGSFGGQTLYQNSHYVSPNVNRALLHKMQGTKYASRIEAKKSRKMQRPETSYKLDPTDEIFRT